MTPSPVVPTAPPSTAHAARLSVAGWFVGGTILAALWIWEAWPSETSELGAYHDPNAADVPLAGLLGWMVGGIVGVLVALSFAKHARANRTAAILVAMSAAAFLPAAFVIAVLSAFGGVLLVVPALIGWGATVPPLALALAGAKDRSAESARRALLPPPPAESADHGV